jgi:hypothetical protein
VVQPFFRDNLNSGAYIVLKELNQVAELFKSFYRKSIESGSCRISNLKTRYKFLYSRVSRRKTTDCSDVTKVYLFIDTQILQISKQIQYLC